MLAPEFLPIWGGTGSYTVELLRLLPKEMDIHVITLKRQIPGMSRGSQDSLKLDSIIGRPLKVHYISSSHETFFYNLSFQIECLRKIPSLHKTYRFDVIHSHLAHMPDVLLQLFKSVHVPTVTTIHGTVQMLRDSVALARSLFNDNEQGERQTLLFYPVIKFLQQNYAKHVSKFIAVSQITKNLAVEHLGVPAERIDVVYNGVDPDLFCPPDANEAERKFRRPTVTYVGRMVGKKGIHVLIKAIPKVLRDFPEAHFLFVGGGNIIPYEEIMKKDGISEENYSFLGQVGYYQRPRILREATVFVNPSFFENCSISILEAMSSGSAVVAHNTGGNPEIIESGRNGLLVPVFDHEKLAESILSLLEDEDFNRKLGQEARVTVEKSFSSRKSAEQTFGIYKNVLNSSL